MAVKLVWAYAIIVLLGGLAMLLFWKWNDAGDWPGFVVWATGMAVAVTYGLRRGLRRRREMNAHLRSE